MDDRSLTKYMTLRLCSPRTAPGERFGFATSSVKTGESTPESFLPTKDVDAVKCIVKKAEEKASNSCNAAISLTVQ